jgi:hypothetical protein
LQLHATVAALGDDLAEVLIGRVVEGKAFGRIADVIDRAARAQARARFRCQARGKQPAGAARFDVPAYSG